MKNLSDEIMKLSEIASCIAKDDFKALEKKIKSYKVNIYSPVKLYESILQSYLVCGLPAAIESFKVFRKYYKEFVNPEPAYNISVFRKRGNRNCKLIYKKNFKKLIENMNGFSPDLKEWIIIDGYGKVLGRKGLTLLEREFINVSILCTRFYENQLHSHLKGCLHLGASKIELKALLNNLNGIINFRNINKGLNLISKV